MSRPTRRRRSLLTTLALLLAAALPHVAGAQDGDADPGYLWVEAEDYDRGNFADPDEHPFAPAGPEQAAMLSGGQWIGAGGELGDLFLEYEITVPEAGEYAFYVRKFWKHGPFRWRFDDRPWRELGHDIALLDAAVLRTHTVANWVRVGEVELDAGQHTLRVEMMPGEGAAGFDAWLLTRRPFEPRGKLKPGESYGVSEPGWFAWEPPLETDRLNRAVDLAALNEDVAGSKGFIGYEGQTFIHTDTGEPIRFWGVNAGGELKQMSDDEMQALARFLAARGVNLVRLHGTTYPASGDLSETDPEQIAQVQRFVKAMKDQGIYTCLSIYFPLWVRLDEEHGWAGYNDQIPFALLYFDPEFQDVWRGWYRDLLTAENPYTGVPLAREPAVAFAEVINEDSFFFYTFDPYGQIPAEQMPQLEKRFGDHLAKQYGSIEKALEAHGEPGVEGDHPDEGRVGLPNAWRMANVRDQRSKDAVAFLTRLQRDFYENATRFLKRDLGFGGSVYASNWTTASDQYLTPLEKHTYLASDHLDRHGYFGPAVEGEGSSYGVREGHVYADRAAVRFDRANPADRERGPSFSLPTMDTTYGNAEGLRPSTLSEFTWPMPNRYRADLPLVAAGYASLQDLDAPMFFALAGPTWMNSIDKFSLQTPDVAGQFPAAALIYRRGLVQTGPVVAEITRGVEALTDLEGAPTPTTTNADDFRAAQVPADGLAAMDQLDAIDPRAYFIGQVHVKLVDGRTKSVRLADLPRYIDDEAGAITSATGELNWNYKAGLLRINAPQARAVTGFLREAGAIQLGGVTVRSSMDYGAVTLVALDGRPVERSGRLLLQVMSEIRNHGYRTEPAGDGRKRIANLGGPPLMVKHLAGRITLPDADWKATALDANLVPTDPVAMQQNTLTLQPDVIYYLLER